MKIKTSVLLFLSTVLIAPYSAADSTHHWGYQGKRGPAHWGQLDKSFATCQSGLNQSPVNIKQGFDTELPALSWNKPIQTKSIINNGHTIQLNVEPGSILTWQGETYELKQFHFHTPSENQIDGKSFPLEMHLVHASEQGKLAVVAVMFEQGHVNQQLQQLWGDLPKADEQQALSHTIAWQSLLPAEWDYFYFNGSLTTPPCTEGVRWFVIKSPVKVDPQQVAKFAKVLPTGTNNRPVQAINARQVLK
ncbi:carbonic anhydrase family protein [Zooshikella marina]|uniref:carbonic anhydrase n=1 Tax=Zooshikella ganghwensis TaxID=202772 RepID=UPI001BAFA503|nr:carbonic anhydrase family protein [Zooshikella ganghwensis]MBU2706897.1 carbonic anhydrase family protein [Zooshikella ganghwensis]